MEQEKICFVSMPFGKKTDLYTGRQFDFDQIYQSLLLPAAEDAGYKAVRADDLAGSIIFRPLLERVIASDVFIADVTTANPNVLYELGLRHALSNATTVLVMASSVRLPFDISFARVIIYKVDDSGNLIDLSDVRRFLAEAIRQGIGRTGSDSPVYRLFPELHVELPGELIRTGQKTRSIPEQTVQAVALPPGLSSGEPPKKAEQDVGSGKDLDPASVLVALKGYQTTSAWADLVRYANALPQSLREMPQVEQLTALALNRLGRGEEGIAMMRSLIARTGGDSDSYGILGQIFKGLYASGQNRAYLEEAIASYRSAFTIAPNDYYSGINLASLLSIYGGTEAQKELSDLVPRLRSQLEQRITDPRTGYWDIESAFQLAVIARDWSAAEGLLSKMIDRAPSQWMLQLAENNLGSIAKSMEVEDQAQIQKLVNSLNALTGRQGNA